jgi:hypothetical protein
MIFGLTDQRHRDIKEGKVASKGEEDLNQRPGSLPDVFDLIIKCEKVVV